MDFARDGRMVMKVLFSCVKFLKELTNELGFVNVILLHSNQRHWIDLAENRGRWQALRRGNEP